jgi:hypothetical protein
MINQSKSTASLLNSSIVQNDQKLKQISQLYLTMNPGVKLVDNFRKGMANQKKKKQVGAKGDSADRAAVDNKGEQEVIVETIKGDAVVEQGQDRVEEIVEGAH